MTDQDNMLTRTSSPRELNADGVSTKGINPSVDPLTQVQMAYIMLTKGTDEQKQEAMAFFAGLQGNHTPDAVAEAPKLRTPEEIIESLEDYVKKSYGEVHPANHRTLTMSLLRAIDCLFDGALQDLISSTDQPPKAFLTAFFSGTVGCKILINPEWISFHQNLLKDYDKPNIELALSIQIIKRIKQDLLGYEEGERYNYQPILFPNQGEPVVHLSAKGEKGLVYILKGKINKFVNSTLG